MEISRGEIIEAIKVNKLITVDEVGDATEAGTVCGSCHEDIEKILKTINGK